jgi:DNA-binding response OmpR family regulator
MNSEVIAKGDRVILVSVNSCDQVQKCLLATRCEIIKVNNGEDAIFKAQHATFDVAVLVSTGKTMDMTETVFNLRDTRPSMPILIIATDIDREEAEIIAHACPNTRSVALDELAAYLSPHDSGKGLARSRGRF